MQKLGRIFLLEMIQDWFKNIVPLKKIACGGLSLRPERQGHRQKYHVLNWTSKLSENHEGGEMGGFKRYLLAFILSSF
jgi:hypothetical protein